jgi:carboxyl-terminal processing protease
MEKYLASQNLLSEFVLFAANKGVAANPKQINISKRYLLNQLEAYISRNTLGDSGFYPLLYKDDATVKRALEQLKKK